MIMLGEICMVVLIFAGLAVLIAEAYRAQSSELRCGESILSFIKPMPHELGTPLASVIIPARLRRNKLIGYSMIGMAFVFCLMGLTPYIGLLLLWSLLGQRLARSGWSITLYENAIEYNGKIYYLDEIDGLYARRRTNPFRREVYFEYQIRQGGELAARIPPMLFMDKGDIGAFYRNSPYLETHEAGGEEL